MATSRMPAPLSPSRGTNARWRDASPRKQTPSRLRTVSKPKPAETAAPSEGAKPSEGEAIAVALRIRPHNGRSSCVTRQENEAGQVWHGERPFAFDTVFGPEASQSAVFDTATPLIDRALDGYNATVLAYGQTGSGKTHTMGSSAAHEGADPETEGLIPRALRYLFAALEARGGSGSGEGALQWRAHASFIEVYNEKVYDLLGPSTPVPSGGGGGGGGSGGMSLPILELRHDASGRTTLAGKTKTEVGSPAEALAVLALGARNRAVGATAMNAASSRSHAIFAIELQLRVGGGGGGGNAGGDARSSRGDSERSEEGGGGGGGGGAMEGDAAAVVGATTSSGAAATAAAEAAEFAPSLTFVDLAGSECAKRTGATGRRLDEGGKINQVVMPPPSPLSRRVLLPPPCRCFHPPL